MEIKEQSAVLDFNKHNLIVSASAGSGKTYILIKLITKLIVEKRLPIRKLLILTFTKNASIEMKERLLKNLKGLKEVDDFILKQIDDLSVSNISTIHSYCEHCLKKYANILKLKENFTLADENLSNKLKKEAMSKCLKNLSADEDFFEVYYAFKSSEEALFKALMEIDAMTEAVADKEKFIDSILNEQASIFDRAEKIVSDNLEKLVARAEEKIESVHLDFDFKLSFLKSGTLLEKAKFLEDYTFPRLPLKKEIGEENVLFLNEIKKELKDYIDNIKALSLCEEKIEEEKKGYLEKALIKVYLAFEEEYEKIKKARNILDFSDLEQNMLKLIENDLFSEDFEYVFIDEYQDTNSLQERIVKTVAKKHFVAVGDAKQGIYGFRLASSKIFLKDVEEFSKSGNDEALFLKSNFRTSGKILSFVNDVFKGVMTEENSNIDYEKTSMLEGRVDFKGDGVVCVDVVVPEKADAEEVKDVYSVKEDALTSKDFKRQLQVVKVRLEEALKSKIYDPDIEAFRQCEFKDIAIISRSRSNFYNKLYDYLRENNFPVVVDKKSKLLDKPEIKILLNILKITLCENDEVALLSILMSNFGRLSQDDILSLRGKDLFESVKENYPQIVTFLEEFKADGEVLGFRRAFEILFDKTNYLSYISTNGEQLGSVMKFLDEIETSAFDFDLPSLIAYFENVDVSDGEAQSGENAILLTTIHKTKGLEYPVVMIIGAGNSLKKQEKPSEIGMDENLGIAVKRYEGGEEEKTVKLLAIGEISKQKRFQEEMMNFYVALTRVKNRLYIIGEYKNPYSITFDTYFDYIFNTLSPEEIDKFLNDEVLEKDAVSFHLITEVEEFEVEKERHFGVGDERITRELENFLNFEYRFKNEENISYKNSVTGLTKKYEETQVFLPSNTVNVGLDTVEVGNAYHLALKTIDFEKISSVKDIERYFESNKVLQELKDKVDFEILLKNIEILKRFTAGGQVFKEQEFVMRDTLENLMKDARVSDEILVQGVIDLFILKKDKATLIDYKYSNTKDKQRLLSRYKTQLNLYKKALVSGLGVKVEEVFLLNLKSGDLIEISE